MAHSLLQICGLYGDKSLDWHRFQIRLMLPYGGGCAIHWHHFTIRRVQRCDATCSAMPNECFIIFKAFLLLGWAIIHSKKHFSNLHRFVLSEVWSSILSKNRVVNHLFMCDCSCVCFRFSVDLLNRIVVWPILYEQFHLGVPFYPFWLLGLW